MDEIEVEDSMSNYLRSPIEIVRVTLAYEKIPTERPEHPDDRNKICELAHPTQCPTREVSKELVEEKLHFD